MYAPDHAAIATSIGLVVLEGDDECLTAICLLPAGEPRTPAAKVPREAAAQIAAWFDGRLTAFNLPLAPARSPRGAALRQATVAVEHGDTASYGQIARAIASSARAVGQACARNPFPLVVPCHRVLQAGGVLGPYSAGQGPVTKQWLLDFEAQAKNRDNPISGST